MHQSVYDSQTFADRSVAMLRSPKVRQQLAERISDDVAADGNQTAVAAYPCLA